MSENTNIIWKKHNYLNKDINCLIGYPIRVYDMKSGGYSILKKNGVFSKKEIKYLDNLSKYERNVYIGKMIEKDGSLNEILMNGFIDAREKFMDYNSLNDEDILSIKKDALFLMNRSANKLQFNGYTFKVEDVFSSYYYMNDKEFYFSNKDNKIELKGINDETLLKHREFFLDDLCNIFKVVEGKDIIFKNKFIQNYRSTYLKRDLDIGCYRELNEDSCFSYINVLGGTRYLIEETDDIYSIDIVYNYKNYLLELFRMIF